MVPDPPTGLALKDPAAEEIFLAAMLDATADDLRPPYRSLRDRAPALLLEDGTLVLSGHAGCDAALRYDAPVQIDSRTVLEPTTLHGADLAPGQVVIALLGAANHDPARFTDPDRLDVARTDNPHLSFASGIHFCLGAHLARLEGEIAFTRLLERFTLIEQASPPRRRRDWGSAASPTTR